MTAAIEPSAIVGSPYRYLYLYLTPRRHEGLHIIISDAKEYGREGILVGVHPHYEQPGSVVYTVHSVDRAISRAKKLIDMHGRSQSPN